MVKRVRLVFADKYFLVFLFIFIFSFILRILAVLNCNFAFTMDQGRDMLDLRNIIVGKHLALIGPTTSVNGVFLGPFWYYFNLIPNILGRGNPFYLVLWLILWFQLAGLILWLYLKKFGALFALFASGLFLMSPALFSASSYSWNSNLAPVFSLFFFLSLFWFLERTGYKRAIILGLILGLCLQIQAAFGILLLPFTLIIFSWKKVNFRLVLFLVSSFLLTLLPQLFFELRHNFLMTRTFVDEFFGTSAILGEKLTLLQTIFNHLSNFNKVFDELTKMLFNLSSLIFLIGVLFLYLQTKRGDLPKKLKDYFLIPTGFLIFSFVCYLFYPHSLKFWFLFGFYIPLILIMALFLARLLQSTSKFLRFLVTILFLTFFVFVGYLQVKLIYGNLSGTLVDKSSFKNELAAVDWVYQMAGGKGFRVYNYIPSVYDYPYQYIFWWYGESKYGYQPESVSYGRNVPQYITNDVSYWQNRKSIEGNYQTFLITEKDNDFPQRLLNWRAGFNNLCSAGEKDFNWGTRVEILENCPT